MSEQDHVTLLMASMAPRLRPWCSRSPATTFGRLSIQRAPSFAVPPIPEACKPTGLRSGPTPPRLSILRTSRKRLSRPKLGSFVRPSVRIEPEEISSFEEALQESKVRLSDFSWVTEDAPSHLYRDGTYPPLHGILPRIRRGYPALLPRLRNNEFAIVD
jgi:hypothetical protein